MIGLDIEGKLRARVRGKLPDTVTIRDTYQPIAAKFPLLTLRVMNHAVYEATVDSGSLENHAVIDVEVEVFTNAEGVKKNQAWEIMDAADFAVRSMGFVRKSCVPTPNLADSTVYRLTARYRGVVDEKNNVYRR